MGTKAYRSKERGARSPSSQLAEGLSILSQEEYCFCASELLGKNSNNLNLLLHGTSEEIKWNSLQILFNH